MKTNMNIHQDINPVNRIIMYFGKGSNPILYPIYLRLSTIIILNVNTTLMKKLAKVENRVIYN